MEDVANRIANGGTADEIIALGDEAEKAAAKLEVLKMTAAEKAAEKSDNFSQISGLFSQKAEAMGRQNVQARLGVTQAQAEAAIAQRQSQIDLEQATVEDINKKYEDQLDVIDKIGQHQQATANLERGRMSVANALSQGDIAAAADAAQQQRNDMAQFARDQMRNQLENQQRAAIQSHQNEIDRLTRLNRDTQNQINAALADAQVANAANVGYYQSQADQILIQNGLIDAQVKKLQERNALLDANRAVDEPAQPPPTPTTAPTPTQTPPPPTVAGPAPLSAAEQAWLFFDGFSKQLNNKEIKFLEDSTFKVGRGGGAWKKKWLEWSDARRQKVMNAVKDGKITAAEEKELKFATGGLVPGFGNSDSVKAMLTPGEFVVNKAASARFGPVLQAINSGAIKAAGNASAGDVRIDNVVFNINGANLNEREVADIAVRKMHSLNSATIRGGRF